MAPPADRPTGVTVLAVLAFVGAGACALGAFAMLALAAGGALFGTTMQQAPWFFFPFAFFSAFLVVFALFAALFLLGFGALALAVGLGLLRKQAWAWIAAMVLAGLWALGGLGSFARRDVSGIVPLVAGGAAIWYLWRPEVRAHFGRA